ncbi:trigger factor [Leptolyngbya cf. ectocarpi LEGE 11479]|uniref:Trigger factor n=1 Tax=Leptolyngbya cf. ectocarpi LEGE 11479 TaxID=1828722 RepID=A0A928X1H9_LEPEC|nr:trigger factor [Leptolyngbya ectocarpi]MBE9066185.1 trigger factor [Leptolyngbya cf. ectocarpi LEGE 11479]
MKVTQERLPDSQVGLEIEVPADISKQTYEQTLRKYMKTANIPGFRKGKVPRQILVQQLGATRLKAAALEELVQTVIDKAIAQEEIEALGNYQLRSGFETLIEEFEPGKSLTISASVDVPPQAELQQYKDLSVQSEEVVYNSERITETLESYQQNLASLVPIEDRAAQEGDVAVVDFVGKTVEEGKPPEEFEGGSASEFQVEIKEGRFIPGFVEGIVGMELGQTKDVEVSFPEEYPQEDLAGKPAVFAITLNDLKERELPDLDDDLAQEVSEFETLEELKQSLEERFKKEAEDATKANTEKALLDELVTHLQVEIPKTLLQREVDHIVTQTVMQLSNQGIDINKFLTKELVGNMRENAKPEATERLRRTLALGEVAKQESISVEEDAIAARIKEMMAEVDNPADIDQDRLKQVVNEDLLKEKILAWLAENATVELVPEGSLSQTDDDTKAVDGNAASEEE